jgi:hypothetical protein
MATGKSWGNRLSRLVSMSMDELLDRTRQQLNARADVLLQRASAFPKVRIRGVVAGEGPQFFFSREDLPAICAALQARLPEQVQAIQERAERICQHRFDLLGYPSLDYGPSIDWHLDAVHRKGAPRKAFHKVPYLDFAQSGDVKITWELNRHQHFITLAKAYLLSGNEKYVAELGRQWQQWRAENPCPVGVNWASSLEVAFRSLSWLWAGFLLEGCPHLSSAFRDEWLRALGASARHISRNLSTYFSPNTHLLGEGVALFFIGTLCPQLEPAAAWREQGWKIVLQEAERQVRPDGFHFEQSVYYHVYALDFFLHTRILAARNGRQIPSEFDRTIERMLDALYVLSRSGPPPSFGDDDGGRLFDGQRNRTEHLLDPLATGAALFGRGDFKSVAGGSREETLWLFGTEGLAKYDALEPAAVSPRSQALPDSGLYVMGDEHADSLLVIDAGPLGSGSGGHGHADALSVWAHSGGRPLLVDSGTFEYVGEGSERDTFRGTAAHNTLTVDGLDQTEPKGPFGWSELTRSSVDLWVNGKDFDLFAGSHDGYRWLREPVRHRRWVFSLKSHFWLVRDVVEGSGQHLLDVRWHLAPGLNSSEHDALTFTDAEGRAGLRLLHDELSGWTADITSEPSSPAYGSKRSATVASFRASKHLPADFVTLLIPTPAQQPSSEDLVRLDTPASTAAGWRYATGDQEHWMVFSSARKPWVVGAWSSDAEFLYFSHNENGQRRLLFANGTFVESEGVRIVSCAGSMTRFEMTDSGQHRELSSSQDDLITHHGSLAAMSMAALSAKNSPAPHGVNR